MRQNIIDYKDGLSKLLRKLRIEVTKDDRYKQGRVLEIDKVVRRLNCILDSCDEEDQTVNRNYSIGHIDYRHLYKSDWQRVNEAEADRIEAGKDSNSYEILESTLYSGEKLPTILKTRRLSDGEVFSIGDKVADEYWDIKGIIRTFRTDLTGLIAGTDMVLETDSAFISLKNTKKIQ